MSLSITSNSLSEYTKLPYRGLINTCMSMSVDFNNDDAYSLVLVRTYVVVVVDDDDVDDGGGGGDVVHDVDDGCGDIGDDDDDDDTCCIRPILGVTPPLVRSLQSSMDVAPPLYACITDSKSDRHTSIIP